MTPRQLIALLRLQMAPGHELPECELDRTTMLQLARPELVRLSTRGAGWYLTVRGAEVARDALARARETARRWR